MIDKKIYEEFVQMKKEDFDKLICSAQSSKEQEFWMAVRNYFFNNPQTLYHYTNFSALEGILIEEKMRMCRTDNMNDSKEMNNFIELIEEAVINRVGVQMKQSIQERFAEERKKRQDDIAYLSSFLLWKDDASQWERYGNDGYGVAIAFNYEKLKCLANDKGICLQKVFYGEDARYHKLVDVLEDLFLGKSNIRHHFNSDDWEAVFFQAWVISVAHKIFSFESEKEIRLVTLPTGGEKRYDKLGDSHVVTTPYGIKECLYFDWKKGCYDRNIPIEELITEIIIGPRSSVKVEDLQEWLKDKKLDCLVNCVRKSGSTLK